MTTKELANEIVNVLKYNPELSHHDKVLAIELRLNKLVSETEDDCASLQKQAQENAIQISDYTFLPMEVFKLPANPN